MNNPGPMYQTDPDHLTNPSPVVNVPAPVSSDAAHTQVLHRRITNQQQQIRQLQEQQQSLRDQLRELQQKVDRLMLAQQRASRYE
jgi:peptidoglycan hydrolase CwlO-like protein